MEINNIKPDIRYLNDMRLVLYDQDWAKTAPDMELYYMYRGIKQENGLRYDITVIPPKMLGKEFVKTKGHEHIGNYQEIYIILEGEAIFLLQKRREEKIEDVFSVKAKTGQSIIIPSSYGHVTINPSKKNLKIANWISNSCQSDYKLFEEKHGACHYYTTDGWIKNENYKNVPSLRFEKPLDSIPENLDFLK